MVAYIELGSIARARLIDRIRLEPAKREYIELGSIGTARLISRIRLGSIH